MLSAADQALAEGVVAATGERQRRAVAKTITLLESTRADHRARAELVLNALLAKTGQSVSEDLFQGFSALVAAP